MSIRVRVILADSDSLLEGYGPGAVVRLERAVASTGPWTAVGNQPLVAGDDKYEFWDPAGDAASWYQDRVTDALNGIQSGWSNPFQVRDPPLTQIAQVRALVSSGISDEDLDDLIAREEDQLAATIGPLAGSRTEVTRITELNVADAIRLHRPTNAVALTEANTAVTDVRLGADGRTLTRLTATGWSSTDWLGVVEATYTPNDQAKIVGWVIDLVRTRLQETGYESESIGDYSYSRGQQRSHAATLAAATRDILGRQQGLTSVRLTTDLSPAPAWIGSVRP